MTAKDVTANSGKRIWWICEKGHEWQATCDKRTGLNRRNCPVCCQSKGENQIRKFLSENQINFEQEVLFNSCKYKQKLPFDFLIKDKENKILLLVEYNGLQHYKHVYFAGKKWTKEKVEKELNAIQVRDNIKKEWCVKNQIPLLIIPYWEFNNIESIINNQLSLLMPSHGSSGSGSADAKIVSDALMPQTCETICGIA